MQNLAAKLKNTKVPTKVFYTLTGLAIISFLIAVIRWMYYLSCDYFYMVPTGKYILQNGVPTTHTHHIFPINTIIQQWLYCVYLYLIHNAGQIGMTLSILITFAAIIYVQYKFFKEADVPLSHNIIAIFLATVISGYAIAQLLTIRPEAITILLLLIQIFCTERFLKTNKPLYIYILPLLMLVEINVHGSMWIIHYIALLPYIVPNLAPHFCLKSDTQKTHIKHLCISTLIMTAAMLVNPYGIKMPMYLIDTFRAHTFDYVDITEIAQPTICSLQGLYTVLIVAVVCFLLTKKKTKISSMYAIIGYTLISITAYRNIVFVYIAITYLMREILEATKTELSINIDIKKESNIFNATLLCIISIICLYLAYPLFTHNDLTAMTMGPTKIIQYLDEHTTKDAHIYTGINSGSFLEYAEYKTYMDSRPELYTDPIGKSGNILYEYKYFGCHDSSRDLPSDEAYEEYINKYDFSYFIIDFELRMKNYLDAHPDEYTYIMRDGDFFLYQRTTPSNTSLTNNAA